ncbi:MAG: hypothetical protein WAW96_07200, partial [Alphaproteobacteria bacterium]
MRLILQLIGFVLMMAGIVLTLSPVPFTFTMIVIGASLIIANNRVVATWLRHVRMRFPLFERAFEGVEQILPQNWRVDGGSIFEDFSSSKR